MPSKNNTDKISNSEYEELIKKTINFDKNVEKSVVSGTVISFDKDKVLIDVGLKSEGSIPMSEFSRPGQKAEIKVGDEFKVFVDRLDGYNGETRLSREKALKQIAWNKLQQSFADGEVVTGTPFNQVKGGFSVDLDGVIAFLPGSQIDSRPLKDTREILNKPSNFLILKMDRFRGNIVVSRKAINDKELAEKKDKLLSNIKEGSKLTGIIKNMTDYGAFIDLGGIDGLVHVTDIAWKKINHPSDVLNLGSEIEVIVLKFDKENTRLSLGIKQLVNDPWENIENEFKLNEIYSCKIININETGIMLSFKDSFDGFVPTKELSWIKKPPHPSKLFQNNQTIEVKLLEIDHTTRRLVCSIKQLKENPWKKISDTFKIEDIIETEIVNKVDFGIFVKIIDEIDGMVHISDLSWNEAENNSILESFKKGDNIKVKILDINKEKERVSLSIKHLTEDPLNHFISKNKIKSIITGEIISIDEKGITLRLENSIAGYMKKSNIAKNKKEQKTDRFAKGEKIDSMIISVDEKLRRINLSIKDKENYEEKEALSQFGSSDSGASLGDILGEALNKKKSD